LNWEGEIQIISEVRKEGESEEELGGRLDGKINKGSLGLAGRISNQIKIRQNKSASNKKHKAIGEKMVKPTTKNYSNTNNNAG